MSLNKKYGTWYELIPCSDEEINVTKKLREKLKDMPLGIKAGIWFVVLQYVQQAINIIATLIFTRLLSEDDYGLINLYNTWHSILTVVLTLKLSASIYQLQMVEYKEDRDNLTSSLVTISTIILLGSSFIVCLFSNTISSAISFPSKMLYIMLADIWAQMILSFWLTRNKFEYEYKKCLIVVLLNCFLRTALSIVMVCFATRDFGYYKVLGNLIPELFFAGAILIRIYSKGKKAFITKYWKEAIKFNIVIVPSYLSEILLSSSDRIMIDAFCPRSDVAYYSLAYSCAYMVQLFFTAINWVFTPYAYNCLNENRKDELKKTASLLTILAALVTGLLVAFAPEAITILAPNTYHDAIWVIPPAACGIFLTFIYGFFVNTEYYYKKNVYITVATIIGAVTNIALNWVFIPIYGYIAAAYTTVVGYAVMTFIHFVFYKMTVASGIYSIRMLLVITAILYGFCSICLLLYGYTLIRYFVIIMILLIIMIKRKSLLMIFKAMRNK